MIINKKYRGGKYVSICNVKNFDAQPKYGYVHTPEHGVLNLLTTPPFAFFYGKMLESMNSIYSIDRTGPMLYYRPKQLAPFLSQSQSQSQSHTIY